MKDVLITFLTTFDADGFCVFTRIGPILAGDCGQVTAWIGGDTVSAVCIATAGVLA